MLNLPVNSLTVTQNKVAQTKTHYFRHKSSSSLQRLKKRFPLVARLLKTPATWLKSQGYRNLSLLTSKNVSRPSKRKSARIWLFRINLTCVIHSKYLSLSAKSSQTCESKRWDNSCRLITFRKCSYLPKSKTHLEHSWLSGSSMYTESLDWCPKLYTSLFIWLTDFSVYNR